MAFGEGMVQLHADRRYINDEDQVEEELKNGRSAMGLFRIRRAHWGEEKNRGRQVDSVIEARCRAYIQGQSYLPVPTKPDTAFLRTLDTSEQSRTSLWPQPGGPTQLQLRYIAQES